MEMKDEYRQKLESLLNEWKSMIEQLEERAKKTTAMAKNELHEAIETLKLKRDAVQTRLDEMRQTGDEAWEGLKKKAETAVTEMKTALEHAMSKFRH
jgi:dsDNA-specific endonuclease/ATPase MutS2